MPRRKERDDGIAYSIKENAFISDVKMRGLKFGLCKSYISCTLSAKNKLDLFESSYMRLVRSRRHDSSLLNCFANRTLIESDSIGD